MEFNKANFDDVGETKEKIYKHIATMYEHPKYEGCTEAVASKIGDSLPFEWDPSFEENEEDGSTTSLIQVRVPQIVMKYIKALEPLEVDESKMIYYLLRKIFFYGLGEIAIKSLVEEISKSKK